MSGRFRGLSEAEIVADMRAVESALGGGKNVFERLSVPRSSWRNAMDGRQAPSASVIEALYGPEGCALKPWLAELMEAQANGQSQPFEADPPPADPAPEAVAPEPEPQVEVEALEGVPGPVPKPDDVPAWLQPALDALVSEGGRLEEVIGAAVIAMDEIADTYALLLERFGARG